MHNQAIKQLRHYDGKSDADEFLMKFRNDLDFMGLTSHWAILNFDRVLDGDAKNWWTAEYPIVSKKLQSYNPDYDLIWIGVTEKFLKFFDHSSQKSYYRTQNKLLVYKIGDDPQQYVAAKLEILRQVDEKMSDVRKIEQLTKALPFELQKSLIGQNFYSTGDFLDKLRRIAEIYAINKISSQFSDSNRSSNLKTNSGNGNSDSIKERGGSSRFSENSSQRFNSFRGNSTYRGKNRDAREACGVCGRNNHDTKDCYFAGDQGAKGNSSKSSDPSNSQSKWACYHCGDASHLRKSCPFLVRKPGNEPQNNENYSQPRQSQAQGQGLNAGANAYVPVQAAVQQQQGGQVGATGQVQPQRNLNSNNVQGQ
jgi:hypothetical protein